MSHYQNIPTTEQVFFLLAFVITVTSSMIKVKDFLLYDMSLHMLIQSG